MISYLKYTLFRASIILSVFSLYSCSDNYEEGSYAEENSYVITTAYDQYTVSADEQTIVLEIEDYSSDNSINWSLTALPSWIKASTTWGRGTSNVSLEIMQNTSFTHNREAVIFIDANSGNNWSEKIPVTIIQDVQVGPYHNNHEYVDLGLPSGLKWATCNIGASVPEQIGNYYAWGETDTKTSYYESNYKYYSSSGYTKYTYRSEECSGTPDKKSTLELSDDAARKNWGGRWRMPTEDEVEELIQNCTINYTTFNDVPVNKIIGPNGNHIIIPHNSEMVGTTTWHPYCPEVWTSSRYQDSGSKDSYARAFYGLWTGIIDRYDGLPVRPVFK